MDRPSTAAFPSGEHVHVPKVHSDLAKHAKIRINPIRNPRSLANVSATEPDSDAPRFGPLVRRHQKTDQTPRTRMLNLFIPL